LTIAIYVFWQNTAKTIIRQNFEGVCTMSDYHRSVEMTLQLAPEVTHTYHVLMDMRKAQLALTNPLSSLGQVQGKVPAHQGIVVMIGANGFLQAIAKIAKQLFPHIANEIVFVSTEDEAIAAMAQRTTTLPLQ
jgi:hypothetical protein